MALFLLHSFLVFQMIRLEEEGGGQNYVNETICLGLHWPCVTIPPYNSVAVVKNRVLRYWEM